MLCFNLSLKDVDDGLAFFLRDFRQVDGKTKMLRKLLSRLNPDVFADISEFGGYAFYVLHVFEFRPREQTWADHGVTESGEIDDFYR